MREPRKAGRIEKEINQNSEDNDLEENIQKMFRLNKNERKIQRKRL